MLDRRQRRLVAKAFTPRATARPHQVIVEIITELLDAHVPVGRCDVAEQFPMLLLRIPFDYSIAATPLRRSEHFLSKWGTAEPTTNRSVNERGDKPDRHGCPTRTGQSCSGQLAGSSVELITQKALARTSVARH